MRLIDLSQRCLFRLSGPDAESYLNGQVTQDVRHFSAADPARWACICTAKGKMQGITLIHRREGEAETFYLDAPAELRESLFARLDRYLIADDAELVDITGEQMLIHSDQPFEGRMIPANRFGFDGHDLWLTPEELASLKSEKTDASWLNEDDLELDRIQAEVPRWGHELTEDTLPPEAKLESRAISYHKGCYVGQETISRIKSVGRVNRQLARFTSATPLEAGEELFLPDDSSKNVAEITSVIQNEQGFVALGYLKRKAQNATSLLTSKGSAITVAPA